jgi:hypothetical protein
MMQHIHFKFELYAVLKESFSQMTESKTKHCSISTMDLQDCRKGVGLDTEYQRATLFPISSLAVANNSPTLISVWRRAQIL